MLQKGCLGSPSLGELDYALPQPWLIKLSLTSACQPDHLLTSPISHLGACTWAAWHHEASPDYSCLLLTRTLSDTNPGPSQTHNSSSPQLTLNYTDNSFVNFVASKPIIPRNTVGGGCWGLGFVPSAGRGEGEWKSPSTEN